jgi:hypothetical protein
MGRPEAAPPLSKRCVIFFFQRCSKFAALPYRGSMLLPSLIYSHAGSSAGQ